MPFLAQFITADSYDTEHRLIYATFSFAQETQNLPKGIVPKSTPNIANEVHRLRVCKSSPMARDREPLLQLPDGDEPSHGCGFGQRPETVQGHPL